jgi:ribokinase
VPSEIKRPSVVVFGSANADMTVRASRLPSVGETVSGTSFAVALGGKGLNQAVAAARLGAPTAMVGRVGSDVFGEQLREGLRSSGVDVGDLTTDVTTMSGVAVVLVGEGGENRIVVIPGANGEVGAEDLTLLSERLVPGTILMLQLELSPEAVSSALALAASREVTVILDPAPVPIHGLPDCVFADHVLLTPNEHEARALVGFELDSEAAIHEAARLLLGRGVGGVVLKLAERGLYWATHLESGREHARDVHVVDTVGAGDAVNGALAAALARGASLSDAASEAVVAGGLAVMKAGACASMPSRHELLAALGQQSESCGSSPIDPAA